MEHTGFIVCMVQGQRPQSAILDHCQMLASYLGRQGITARMAPLLPARGALRHLGSFFGFIRQYRRLRCVYHLHYPGWPLTLQLLAFPHALALRLCRSALVTTIHDLTKFPWLLRLGFVPILLCSRRLIFSTAAELQVAIRLMRCFGCNIARKSHLIPIGSCIPKHPAPTGIRSGIAYFGHIRSGKGIETVLDAAHIMHSGGRTDPFYIIGNIETCDIHRYRYAASLVSRVWNLTDSQHLALARCHSSQEFSQLLGQLQDSSKRLPNVHWLIDADEQSCAATLSRCRFALMPFNDGASMRRSSLQAVLINGCITLATWGTQTDDLLKAVTLRITSAQEAVDIIAHREDFSTIEHALSIHEARIDWESIAALHAEAYASALGHGRA